MSQGVERFIRANAMVKSAVDNAIARGVETGVQVAAYLNGELVIDTWGGLEIGRAHV